MKQKRSADRSNPRANVNGVVGLMMQLTKNCRLNQAKLKLFFVKTSFLQLIPATTESLLRS